VSSSTDDWQRQQYLKQVYLSYEAAREGLRHTSPASECRAADAYTAATLVGGLLRVVEPYLRDADLWNDVHLATAEIGGERVAFSGAATVLEYEDGIEVNTQTAANACLSRVPEKRTELKPLPPEVTRAAFRRVTSLLIDEGVLMPSDDGTVEIAD